MITPWLYQVLSTGMLGFCARHGPAHVRTILGAGLICGLGLSAHPTQLAAASDLWGTCNEEFAVFDRLTPGGRQLHVVPWTDHGDQEIVATTQMPEEQPHAWAIYRRFVAVRTWNDLHLYRLDEGFNPHRILSQ